MVYIPPRPATPLASAMHPQVALLLSALAVLGAARAAPAPGLYAAAPVGFAAPLPVVARPVGYAGYVHGGYGHGYGHGYNHYGHHGGGGGGGYAPVGFAAPVSPLTVAAPSYHLAARSVHDVHDVVVPVSDSIVTHAAYAAAPVAYAASHGYHH